MKIRNVNEKFGDGVGFESVDEMKEAIHELARLNPDAGFEVPAEGLREGRDYTIEATKQDPDREY